MGEPQSQIHPAPVQETRNLDDQAWIPTAELTSPELGHREPSHAFTRHQIFYIFVLDGLGAMLVSGGINFGLAYLMYTMQDTVKNPIRLFQLPNTLAGDAAVTTIIQCIITWFVEKILVANDLARRGVQPIGFISKPTTPWLRWLFLLPLLEYEEAVDEDDEVKRKPHPKPGSPGIIPMLVTFVQNALRGFLIAIVGFVLLWPLSVGILTIFGKRDGGDYTYAKRWTPQIFKGILGGVLGLLTTPPMAMFWLIKAGWESKLHFSLEP
ncbi:hypothetical protein BGZ63DRAFT_351842 [Mariannaea sp. PMI_226]|nr:hypothetical protein BGZ63DRAFT_351842 [Mariannaea sp. PMI_226]